MFSCKVATQQTFSFCKDRKGPPGPYCVYYKVGFVRCNASEFIMALVRLLSCFSADLQYSCFAQEGVGLFPTLPFFAGGGGCKFGIARALAL